MKMEQIEFSETSTYNNQTPGKYPKEYIQDSKHGKSLKSSLLQAVYKVNTLQIVTPAKGVRGRGRESC